MYAYMWSIMLNQHLREMDYMAGEANINSSYHFVTEGMQFNYTSYNTNVEKYLQGWFSSLHNFDMDETYFNN